MTNEHYDPALEERKLAAKKAKENIQSFLVEQATDPLNYLPGGMYSKTAAWVTKGLIAAAGLKHAPDAEAMFWGADKIPPKAMQLFQTLKASKTPDHQIFKQLGIWTDKAGNLRYYTPDVGTVVNQQQLNALMRGEVKQLGDLIPGAPMFKTDPSLAYTQVVGKTFADPTTRAGVNAATGRIAISKNELNNPSNVLNILGHETQHNAQRAAGVQSGGNPAQFLDPRYEDAVKATDMALQRTESLLSQGKIDPVVGQEHLKKLQSRKAALEAHRQAADNKYLELAGEQEARLTQRSMGKDLRYDPMMRTPQEMMDEALAAEKKGLRVR